MNIIQFLYLLQMSVISAAPGQPPTVDGMQNVQGWMVCNLPIIYWCLCISLRIKSTYLTGEVMMAKQHVMR